MSEIPDTPWRVHGEGPEAKVVSCDDWTIAETVHVHGYPWAWEGNHLRIMNLIAAAPELYAFCKRIQGLEKGISFSELEKILAKAEGRSL